MPINSTYSDAWIYAALCGLVDLQHAPDIQTFQELPEAFFRRLLTIARLQGVLGIAMRQLAPMATVWPATWDMAQRCWHAELAQSMRARQHAAKVIEGLAAAGVPSMILRGTDFADQLYPDPRLRPAFDVDVLVPRAQWNQAAAALQAMGYEDKQDQAPLYFATGILGERTWICRKPAVVEIDLHWHLITLPTMRGYGTLEWQHVARGASGAKGLAAGARLVIAAAHSVCVHNFDRILLLADLQLACRAIQTDIEVAKAKELVKRTQSEKLVHIALAIAAALLDDAAMESLRKQLVGDARGLPEVTEDAVSSARDCFSMITRSFGTPERTQFRNWLRTYLLA